MKKTKAILCICMVIASIVTITPFVVLAEESITTLAEIESLNRCVGDREYICTSYEYVYEGTFDSVSVSFYSPSEKYIILSGEGNIKVDFRTEEEIVHESTNADGTANSVRKIETHYYVVFLKEGTSSLEIYNENTQETLEVLNYVIDKVDGEPYVEYLVAPKLKIGSKVGGKIENNWLSFSALYRYHNFETNSDIGYRVSDLTSNSFESHFIEGTNYVRETSYDYESRIYYDFGHVGTASRPGVFSIAAERDEENPYNVIIEDPIINTNLPDSIQVGTEMQVITSLDNTDLQNNKVADFETKTWKNIKGEIGYRPRIEIISGEELVERGTGDYTNTLNTSENMVFVGEGSVTFKVIYEMFSLSGDNQHPCYIFHENAIYSPEATFTVNIVSEKVDEPQNNTSLPLKFSAISLYLQDNLSINYKVNAELFGEDGYTFEKVVLSLDEESIEITELPVVEDGKYVFTYDAIAPAQMGKPVTAIIYATYEGKTVTSEPQSYSVSQYCYAMMGLNSTQSNVKLRTLMVDLLNYGAAAQKYAAEVNGATILDSDLVYYSLTDAQKAWATSTTPTVTSQSAQNIPDGVGSDWTPTITYLSAGLRMDDAVTIRLKIKTSVADVTTLTAKITSDSNSTGWLIPGEEMVATSDGYYLYFDGLMAKEMREKIYVTFYSGSEAVSKTLTYSIETYAHTAANADESTVSTITKELMVAMMKYGDSAKAFLDNYKGETIK